MRKILLYGAATLTLWSCSKTPDYDATGFFETVTVTVSAETAGRIMAMDISEGDRVDSGSRIALVDTVLLSLQREQTGSRHRSAETNRPDVAIQIASLRSQIDHQRNECARQERLYAAGATTRKHVDDANAALSVLTNQLRALESTLTKSREAIGDDAQAIAYQLGQIDVQIEKCNIISPLSGVVLEKYAEQGEYALPGKALCKIGDLDNVYLRAYFTVSQLADIKLGQEVTVIADFGGDEQYSYPGTISWIAQESEFTPKSVQTPDSRANLVYAVKIAVHNDGKLKLGQYGQVSL